jgi:hypothetical protein
MEKNIMEKMVCKQILEGNEFSREATLWEERNDKCKGKTR